MVLGIVAHVDAGKTTLSEALLYRTGEIQSLGRVDHQDAYLDTDSQERERGITIFSKQARIRIGDRQITILDTPGHVDFSAEMERTLQVLDYAVLVISGTAGVQSHTRTLWRLLAHYRVPTIIYVNKMDLLGEDGEAARAKLQRELRSQLADTCIDFSAERSPEELAEDLAVCSEDLLNRVMEDGVLSDADLPLIQEAIARREAFPCFYGSALKLEGVDALLAGIARYCPDRPWNCCSMTGTSYAAGEHEAASPTFAARVYKIARDTKNVRLTYLKVVSGSLKTKDTISYGDLTEKVNEIRLYSGDRYETATEVGTGEVCAVTGLTATYPGQGLGNLPENASPVLEPVLSYQIHFPSDINPMDMLGKLRTLEEENPELQIVWKEEVKEIHAKLMGQVMIEVLTRQILDRFGIAVVFGQGSILYKETIARAVEGVGHFEPLRHYAEAHILMEPGEIGSGIQVYLDCPEDLLDLNWQRLIATHIAEREHPGVLTGSPLTDVRCTVVGGRAHNKHTEGGDFRQATYRAIRQGLMSTECVLLEPYFRFTLELPSESLGRAMTDLSSRHADFEAPEYLTVDEMDMARIKGRGPVSCLHDYMKEVHSYTKGLGSLSLENDGYDVCHNSEEVIAKMGYHSEEDTLNPTASVFCAHGAGYLVPWNEVPQMMHVDYVYDPEELREGHKEVRSYVAEGNAFSEEAVRRAQNRVTKRESTSAYELDKELQEIYAREFGMNRTDVEEEERKKWMKKTKTEAPSGPKLDKHGNPIYPKKDTREDLLIVDGYNIIFAWEDLKDISTVTIDGARDRLLDILSDYQGFRGCRLMVVFDAYRVKGRATSKTDYHNLEVVYTKTDEIADVYIERLVHEIRDKYRITVATNDNLEQQTILSLGGLRMSASELRAEIDRVHSQSMDQYGKR